MTYEYLPESEIYRNRIVRTYNSLDDAHFDFYNHLGASELAYIGSGNLDRQEQSPSGHMTSKFRLMGLVSIDDFVDSDTLHLSEKLIDEILKELSL